MLTPLRSSLGVYLAAFLGFARLRPFGDALQVVEATCPRCLELTQTAMQRQFPALYAFEVISIYASLASSALGHRGLQHFHRNTGFARFCGYFQINRDNLKYTRS